MKYKFILYNNYIIKSNFSSLFPYWSMGNIPIKIILINRTLVRFKINIPSPPGGGPQMRGGEDHEIIGVEPLGVNNEPTITVIGEILCHRSSYLKEVREQISSQILKNSFFYFLSDFQTPIQRRQEKIWKIDDIWQNYLWKKYIKNIYKNIYENIYENTNKNKKNKTHFEKNKSKSVSLYIVKDN
eukprot:GHVL01016744.1.p2 GENE.GHVL01016744.1~~GHVL01016744.1.p2  ORF type:complete len:185 (+),score=60.21 GHVL01016744.1:572-1126(+)